jgi:hypothetical protein
MNNNECIVRVIDALEELEIPYMLVGSYSANTHGVERASQDADLVIDASRPFVPQLAARLGSEFVVDPQMSFEGVTSTFRNVIAVVKTGFEIELFRLSDGEYDRTRFARRMTAPLAGRMVFVQTAEDVIVTKLAWLAEINRDKDRFDVRHVLAVQGDALDFDYIRTWTDRQGTSQLLEQLRANLPRLD